MSALTVAQGLQSVLREIAGLRSVILGEPTGSMELPALYLVYQEFDRPLRNSPPARNLTGMSHTFAARLCIQWVNNSNAEMQLLTLLDAIPDAIDRDPTLGGRVSKGVAWIDAGVSGFATIGGVVYRVVEYRVHALEKREGT
jgi:hypothetical protein